MFRRRSIFLRRNTRAPLLLAGLGSVRGLACARLKDSAGRDLIGLGLPVGNLANQEFPTSSVRQTKAAVSGEFDAYGRRRSCRP